jgi:hypothetical protein
MIRYTLVCDKGHEFETWFQSSAAFDNQHKRKLVTCPACNSAKVNKAIMAPRLNKRGKTMNPTVAPTPPATTDLGPSADSTSLISTPERELRAKLKELRDHIISKADHVGDSFPNEARKMHYGEIENRPIYGEASLDEARALIEEGIEVAPLPTLPDERN